MRKKKDVEKPEIDYSAIKEDIKEEKCSEVLKENFMPYSMSVIVSRALPEIDGLKPAHRKVLYTMYLMGLLTGGRSKSANIAGQTLKLNPHSDRAVYETMVRLTDDNETLLTPLIDSKGNMGKHYSRDMAFSAARYCVAPDTLIATDIGLIRMKDIALGTQGNSEADVDITVKSMRGKNNKASKLFNSGKQKVFSVILKNGMRICATPNHPLLIKNEEGKTEWKLVEDIQVGDQCIVDCNTDNALFGENNDLFEASYIGSFIGAGKRSQKDNCLTVKSKTGKDILPLFVYFNTENKEHQTPIQDLKEDGYCMEMDLTEEFAKQFCLDLNLQTIASEQFIPHKVMIATEEYQKTFLTYLFASAGTYRDNCLYITPRCDSRNLCRQLQVLLATNFGVLTEIDKKPDAFGKKRNALIISDNYKAKFMDLIDTILPRHEYLKTYFKDKKSLQKKYMTIPVAMKTKCKKQTVYSVKVESSCHSFSANGFINHNTEAKLSKVSEEFFKGINKDSVDFVENYDSTMKEPKLLPVSFPNILANPTQGIAVGMASNICSFNLKELCEATILHIKKPKADIMDVMPAPDFTTGGYILYNKDDMRQIYETGKGSIRLKAKYKVNKKMNIIEILEIPYTTTIEAIMEGVVDLIKKGKIKEINDIRDEIDKDGFKIAIDYKRSVDPDLLMKKLFKLTKLQDSFGCNFNVLIDGKPQVLGVYSILDEWIKWRQNCIQRQSAFDLNKKKKDLNILKGLEKIFLNLNKVIKIIRETEDDASIVPNLMAAFKLDEQQATYIADLKLRNLNKEYIANRTKDIPVVEKEIAQLEKVLTDVKEVNKIIIKDLTDVAKKYGAPRKSEIIDADAEEEYTEQDIIEDYDLMLYRTRDGYIKKLPLTSLRTNPELKIKEGDEIIQEWKTSNKTEILFFTNKCNVYKTLCYNIKDCKPSDFGEYSNNMLEMDRDEEVIYMCPINVGKTVLIGFKNGKVAKFPISNYETKNNRKKLINAFYGGSEILNIFVYDEDFIVGIKSSKNKLLLFNTKMIPEKAIKTTQGVQAIKLANDAEATEFKKMEDYGLSSTTGHGCKSLPAVGGNFNN